MDISVQNLSFFVIQGEEESESTKRYKHYQTLNEEQYESSEIKRFLDGEFVRIVKRKVEKNPNSENAPTKVGRFIVEPGHPLDSNPNFNLFDRLLTAEDKDMFLGGADEMVRTYMDTSAVRGGAFIVSRAKINPYFDEPFLFIMKCDFEQKIARISDEKSLISEVEMAISARNIKSIQYPYMPEEGMREEAELKIHQASHARYFEDFLRFVSYEKSVPEILNEQMVQMVSSYIEEKWQGEDHAERKQEEESFEIWAASEKRELQQKWDHQQVMEARSFLVEQKEDLELKFKLDGIAVKGLLAQYGDQIHIARMNGRYIVLIEGDSFQFDKGVSPIELLNPQELDEVIEHLKAKPSSYESRDWTADEERANQASDQDKPPWES
ncbi:DUF3900 domain-containing protein [Marinicrinis lubricantis]|uniref:DUF3900 domain-containing protein n=1 Tax=Marinicrinis lubricantis TaxID=2086470 RepID=A0ABW1IM69_9BACL